MKIGQSRNCLCDSLGTGNNPRPRYSSGKGLSVAGLGPYTRQSSICNAALHAGAIGKAGGLVTFTLMTYDQPFLPSLNNDIRSKLFAPAKILGGDNHAIRFAGKSGWTGFCPASVKMVARNNDYGNQPVSCRCSASRMKRLGQAYGNGRPYSTFSDPCRAAQHWGALGTSGGIARFQIYGQRRFFKGYPNYPSVTRNGVRTLPLRIQKSSRNWGRNFVFGSASTGVSSATTRATSAQPITTTSSSSRSTTEYNTNRYGGDYRSFVHSSQDEGVCRRACEADGRCKAWTWVKPQGRNKGKCWLKNKVPARSPMECCTSGVKGSSGESSGPGSG